MTGRAQLIQRIRTLTEALRSCERVLRYCRDNDKTVYSYDGDMALNRAGEHPGSGQWNTPRAMASAILPSVQAVLKDDVTPLEAPMTEPAVEAMAKQLWESVKNCSWQEAVHGGGEASDELVIEYRTLAHLVLAERRAVWVARPRL